MNSFLQLTERLRAEAGLEGTISSLVGLQGMHARLPVWINQAYQELLQEPKWAFAWSMQPISVMATTAAVPLPDNMGEFDRDQVYWDGALLSELNYAVARQRYLGVTGTPKAFAVRPDGQIALFPVPDANGTLVLDCWQQSHTLNAEADVPLIPEGFTEVIVYRALRMYCGNDQATELYQYAAAREQERLFALRRKYGPAIQLAVEPLA